MHLGTGILAVSKDLLALGNNGNSFAVSVADAALALGIFGL